MYIHELEKWPHFRWDEQRLAGLLGLVRHQQGRLLGRMEALGLGLRAEAGFATLTQDVIKTSEIEGEILGTDQVRSSLARRLGMDIGGPVPADRHVDGVVEMMLDATRNYARPLDAERLFGWHAGLFPTGYAGMVRIPAGMWRDDKAGPMQVVSGPMGKEWVHFEAPAAARVAGEMERFLEWFNAANGNDAVLNAGIAHLWFVTVHPFADGNGRMARAIADMALARSEGSGQRFYSMSAQIREERDAYYAVLEATQKGELDITQWLEWFLNCLSRAFAGAEGTLGAVLGKARFWERHAGAELNERQRAIIHRLLNGFEGKLTSSKWAKIAKCSADTALRDIQELVRLGILQKDAAGGRSTSYALVTMDGAKRHGVAAARIVSWRCF